MRRGRRRRESFGLTACPDATVATVRIHPATSADYDWPECAFFEQRGENPDMLSGQRLHDHSGRLDPTHPDIAGKLDTRGALFCSWSARDRKRRLAALLASFDPLYSSLAATGTSRRGSLDVSPAELDPWINADWPDPRW